MSKIYFNQQVSPQLFRTKHPPNANTQKFFYENHLEDRLKELNNNDIKMLNNIDTLQENQLQQKEQTNHMQKGLEHLFKQFTNKINDVITQITDIKNTSSKQNSTHLKNHETQQAMLQSIDEKQQKMELKRVEESDRTQLSFKEIDQKIDELTTRVNDIKSLSTTLSDTYLKNYETLKTLLQSIDERQLKFEENQSEEIDLTQLLFQELTKKINDIPSQIDDIKNMNAKQTESLIEHHELQEAFLESMEERQIKIEEQQRTEMKITQTTLEGINNLKNNQHQSQRA